jgi:hypothetical protein
MYSLRRFASKHSKAYEVVYKFVEPPILASLTWLNKVAGDRFDKPITWMEKHTKGALFDCQMCGNCVLSKTGMTCPMNCPKTIRNGPCGGVRANGNCEVKPEMKCVWVEAWGGASKMRNPQEIELVQFAVDRSHQGSSAWIRLAKERDKEKQDRKQAAIAEDVS